MTDTNTPATPAPTPAPASGSATGAGAAPTARKPFGHGSKETDVAFEIGAYAGEEKARTARASSRARLLPQRNPNEPPTITGETIPEMRARVRREREAAEPTAFQASLIGRRPADESASLASLTGNVGTEATATGVTDSSTSPTSASPTNAAPTVR